VSNLRFTLRQLRQSPAHIGAAILSLGIGMAVCGTFFSILNALIFSDAPGITDRPSLLHVRWIGEGGLLSRDEFESLARESNADLEGFAAEADQVVPALLPSGAATVPAAFVSARFFETLGTTSIRGRLLEAADARADAFSVVVISEELWRRAYHGDPQAVGRVLVIRDRTFTIVGIAPEGFVGLQLVELGPRSSNTPELWLPLPEHAPHTLLAVVARVRKSAAGMHAVRSRFSVLGPLIASSSSRTHEPSELRAFRAGLSWTESPWESTLVLGVFLMVPLAVLAIGCANVVNLQLSRASDRTRELSVRLTLGASRRQIVGLLGIEIAILILVAGGVGWVGARILLQRAQSLLPVAVTLDSRVLLFFLVLVTAVIAGAGMAPAWLASRDVLASGLKEGSGGVPNKRLRGALVVLQVSGSLVLLFLTGLGIRTLRSSLPNVSSDSRNALTVTFDLSAAHRSLRPANFVGTVLRRLEDDPSISAAGFATAGLDGALVRFALPGDRADLPRVGSRNEVTPQWFEAVGLRILEGRAFGKGRSPFDVVINDSLASLMGGGATVLGRRLRVADPIEASQTVEIVGVVENRFPHQPPIMFFKMPFEAASTLVLVARITEPTAAARAMRLAVLAADPAVPCDRIRTLRALLDDQFSGFRETVWLGGWLGGLALLLSAVGLYAVLAFAVRRRSKEIGIRVAVGATRSTVVALVLRQALGLVVAGTVCGLAVAVPMAYALRSMFVDLSPADPLTLAPAIGLLVLTAGVASLLPTCRALRVDPTVALRDE
jgi:putative ABC transport system permease protein